MEGCPDETEHAEQWYLSSYTKVENTFAQPLWCVSVCICVYVCPVSAYAYVCAHSGSKIPFIWIDSNDNRLFLHRLPFTT